MTSDPDTTPTLDPRLSKIVGGFIMITLGTIAWVIGITGWMILTWQQVIA